MSNAGKYILRSCDFISSQNGHICMTHSRKNKNKNSVVYNCDSHTISELKWKLKSSTINDMENKGAKFIKINSEGKGNRRYQKFPEHETL